MGTKPDSTPTEESRQQICGPDVTDAIKHLLVGIQRDWDSWTPEFRTSQIDSITGLSSFNSAWNIFEFGPGVIGRAAWNKITPADCPKGVACADTVTVHGSCWHRQQVNYILFGVIETLCGGSFSGETLHFYWNTWKLLNPFSTSISRERADELWRIEEGWRIIGTTLDLDRIAVQMLDTNEQGRPETQCATSCQSKVTRNALQYGWGDWVGPGVH